MRQSTWPPLYNLEPPELRRLPSGSQEYLNKAFAMADRLTAEGWYPVILSGYRLHLRHSVPFISQLKKNDVIALYLHPSPGLVFYMRKGEQAEELKSWLVMDVLSSSGDPRP